MLYASSQTLLDQPGRAFGVSPQVFLPRFALVFSRANVGQTRQMHHNFDIGQRLAPISFRTEFG